MKRVNFGHKGGFPLEQETLIHLQRAYADDMLEALLGQWGIDPNQNYLVKEASNSEDGWIVTTIPREEINAQTGNAFTVTKPELLRLKFNGAKRPNVEILDLRKNTGSLEYADGQPKRVYEEWVGQYVTTPSDPTNTVITGLVTLKTIIALSTDIANINAEINDVKQDYLPRNGSRPMTGNLVLGENQPTLVPGQEGNRLYFRGTFSNTDEVYMSKFTPASDVTELRLKVGDNAQFSSRDAFTIGGSVSGGASWLERFRVQTDGRVGIGVTSPARNLDVDAANSFLRFRNLPQVTVNQERALVINTSGDVGMSRDSILTPNATETVRGKAEIATQTETNGSTDNTRFITPRKLHNRTATTARRGIAELADFNEAIAGTDNTKIMTARRVRDFMNSNYRFASGSATVRFSSGGPANTIAIDYTKNLVEVRPPTGYTIFNLVAFLPSIQTIDFAGDVDGNDSFFCRWRRNYTKGLVEVICNNTENRAPARINYLGIWKK
ncbi:hypothetical protein M0D21_01525 [Aquimarina sp. D1M17]|uniref:hypothetical protein n=1 Tax=Aquimarina acroporae TaxID=2937283 RepID=UPI0020BFB925|nr:hypothetical protein [Aquimarina acroporae]MCK8520224.1 hypothetical protein [Aquimarina acroporae]